jgi:signal peptidase II
MPSPAEHATAVAPRSPAPTPATPDRNRAPSTGAPHSRRRAFVRAAVVMVVVLVADRISKSAVVSGIAVGDVHKFLPGVQLVHVRNSGVAFGFLSGGGALVLIVTLLALSALLVYFVLRPQRPLLWLPTGLLLGGALGNLIDRVASGSVTDFIKFPLWPAFNLADTAITFGVLSLLYVLEGPRQKSESDADTRGRS